MTSEDWRLVLLALIGAVVAIYGEILRSKANKNDRKTDIAAVAASAASVKADDAAVTAKETQLLVNGRMDELLKAERAKAYAQGKADGIATVSAGIAKSESINLDAAAVAKAVADASAVKGSPP